MTDVESGLPDQSLLELTAIFENAAVAIFFTRQQQIQRCNQRAAEMFGYGSPDELIGKSAIVIHVDHDSYGNMRREAAPRLSSGQSFHADWPMRKANGDRLWCSIYSKAVKPSRPEDGIVWILEDITEARRMEQALKERQSVIDTTLEYMDQGISIVDADLKLRATNRRFRELLDFPESLCRPGVDFADFVRYNAERGDYGPGDVEEHVRSRVELARRFEPHQFERQRPDGTVLEIRGRPIPGGGFVTVYTDITKRARAEERIQHLATHDSLTDLPNRVLFSQLLNRTIESARRYRREFAVLFVDLDRFKLINDTIGHEAGDVLLGEMAKRFGTCCRASDVVARLGGDEFVVLLQEIDNLEQAAATARRLLSAAIQPVDIQGRECRITASIGICLFPAHAQDEETLMKNADIAMYHAKEQGKNNYQFYSRTIKAQSFDRMALEAGLRRALEREEFFLHYQAKLDFKTGAIAGVEALLRWQHPDLGVVLPGQFISIAEESGLIVPIGKWVLETACTQNVSWGREGLSPVCIAVNLSPRQFADPELLHDLDRILAETGMDPGLLELEITEGMVMGNIDQAIEQLKAIKSRGVRLAIDDFGTGYSSLSQIKRFPIDTLKVDRSFIRDLVTDSEDRAITQAIISMGKTLSLSVVAEGVETEEQQVFLRSHACDQMQGYYFSKPIVSHEFAALLRGHSRETDCPQLPRQSEAS